MRIDITNRNNDYLFIIVILLVVICSYLNQQGVRLSDQYLYAKNAYNIANGDFYISPSVFYNRFGVTLPTAVFIKFFGFNYYIITLWPLFSFLLLLFATYKFSLKFAPNYVNYIVLLMALNPLLLKQSADLLPDLIMMSFSTISIYLLFWVTNSQDSITQNIKVALMFTISFFIATLAKETTVYLIPFVVFVLVYNLKKRINLSFWIFTILFSIILGGVYLGGYKYFTGDILYRLNGIEQEHNISTVWSYHNSSLGELFYRISIGPLIFLFTSHYFSFYLFLGILSIGKLNKHFFKKIYLNCFKHFFTIYFLYLLLIHWLGSTSLSSFNPLPLVARMWILLIPPLCLLAGEVFHKEVNISLKRNLKVFTLFIALSGISIVFYLEQKPQILFSIIFCLLAIGIVMVNSRVSSKKILMLFLGPLFCLQVLIGIKYHKTQTSYFDEKKMFVQLFKQNEKVIIISDGKLADKYDIYFDFNPPSNLKVINWSDEVELNAIKEEPFFLWENKQRAEIINERYKKNYPKFVKKIIETSNPYLSNSKVKIFKGDKLL